MYLSTLLENILHADYDFCGLCYKKLDKPRTELDDEVVLQENNIQKNLRVSEILFYVLGENVFSDISIFPSVCFQCVTSAVNSYRFMKETKENLRYLTAAVENLTDCFTSNEDPMNLDEHNTLFVTLHTEDLSIGSQFYDTDVVCTKHDAWERFCERAFLKPMKQEKNEPIKEEKKENVEIIKEQPQKIGNKMSTVDMTLNGDMSILTCKVCLKVFPTVSNLRNHFLRVHAKDFKCSMCSKSFGTETYLKNHQADYHTEITCSHCGKAFNTIQKFKNHERESCKKIVCTDCGRSYKNRNTYKKHFENDICQTPVRHSPADAKFTCDYCNKRYTQKISLRVHIQYEHLNYKYIECKWCPKKFWCQARLKAHIVKHTKEKNFICSVCSGRFVTKESLLYHTRIHTGEKPYACQFCDSRFLSASRRRAHVKSQHMDPTVECDICHSKFKSLHFLLKHKQSHGQPIQPNVPQKKYDSDSENHQISDASDKHHRKDMVEVSQEEIIYDVIENENHVLEVKTESNKHQEPFRKVEFVLVDENYQAIHNNDKIYLEISEDGAYTIKEVSENVEV